MNLKDAKGRNQMNPKNVFGLKNEPKMETNKRFIYVANYICATP